MSKKSVLKLDIHCDKCKRKALKSVAGVEGVESVAIDVKEKKITIIGEADPVGLTTKLRKFGSTELLSVGPAKEEKKDDKKPDDAKKNEPKKNEAKKDEFKREPPIQTENRADKGKSPIVEEPVSQSTASSSSAPLVTFDPSNEATSDPPVRCTHEARQLAKDIRPDEVGKNSTKSAYRERLHKSLTIQLESAELHLTLDEESLTYQKAPYSA